MLVVEKHQIGPGHRLYEEVDQLLFKSKNLWNSTLYAVRQEFFAYQKFKETNGNNGAKFNWSTYYDIVGRFAEHDQPDYRALPAKVSQQTVKMVFQAVKSWKALRKTDSNTRLPYYKDKVKGRSSVIYTAQAISLKNGVARLSGTTVDIPFQKGNRIHQIRLVADTGCHVIEVVYERYCKQVKKNNKSAAIDIGLQNLAAITFNNGLQPLLVPGGPVKSINQYYNKERARLQAQLGDKRTSKRIKRLTRTRNNKVSDYMHKASRLIVNYLVSHSISTLVVGKNDGWKQGINIGKVNNQQFVQVPHAKFIRMLEYKAKLAGIRFLLTEESYTSKCSFLDQERIRKHKAYKGRRVRRGLFRSSSGQLVNADLNGSGNIMRKAIPKVRWTKGIEVVVVQPVRVKSHQDKPWSIYHYDLSNYKQLQKEDSMSEGSIGKIKRAT